MLRVTIFSVVCLMVLGNVIGQNIVLPQSVVGRREQCQARGKEYVGACISQNLANGSGMNCRQLICAAVAAVPSTWTPGSKLRQIEYEARLTGPPVDGTECAAGSVCWDKKCVFVGHAKVPPQIGPSAEYSCQTPAYRALVRNPQVTPTTMAPVPTRKSVSVSQKKKPQ